MFSRSFKIFTLFGFDIKIDPSWFLIAALITWSLATGYFPQTLPGAAEEVYLTMAVSGMVLFFGSLVLHELAHSLVARRHGVEIKGITLFLFGGVAELGREPGTARSEFLIAVAGPIMSVALAGLFRALAAIAPGLGLSESFAQVFAYLALINLVLAVFNMIPAFPLDGGRVLRAAIWQRTGDMLEATRRASQSGVFFGWVLVAIGGLSVLSGGLTGGLWQVVIGLFLMSAARNTYQQQVISMTLEHKTVGDLMARQFITAAPEDSLFHLVNDIVLRHRVSFVPVVEGQALLGYIDVDTAAMIDRECWPTTTVGDVLIPSDDTNVVSPDLSAVDLITLMSRLQRRKFLVAEGDRLVGVVTMADLQDFMATMQSLHEQSGRLTRSPAR